MDTGAHLGAALGWEDETPPAAGQLPTNEIIPGVQVPRLLEYGIDVSHHNGPINWEEVKRGGIIAPVQKPVDFAFIKATEGASGRDPKIGFNSAECHRLGLPWGPYHYCTLNDKDEARDATQEAQYLLKRLSDLPPYQMPIALDVEDPKALLADDEVETWIKTFFGVLTGAGHPFVLYSYSPFLREHLPQNHSLSWVRLWAARYGGKFPDPVQGWGQKFWCHQFENAGKVAGISGPVDINRILPG